MIDKIKKYRYHLNNAYFDSPLVFGETRLWQIGRLYCAPGTIIAEHTHPNLFELTIATEGKGIISTNGIEVPVKSGDIYLSFPYESHKIVSDVKSPLQYDFIAFTTENPELSYTLEAITNEFSSPTMRIFKDSAIASSVCDAIVETESLDSYSELMLKNIFEQIIIRIVRSFSQKDTNKGKKSATDAEALCYQAMYYIDTHVFFMKSLCEVADSMNYNYSYLSDLFKRTTGQTLADYHKSRKLQAAERHLSDGGSVTRISELLGYSSVYSFSRAFKSTYGISPNVYKKSKAQSRSKRAKESP
ncbi:MAG: AraC family transcriptional regulator [Ruminococcaceae bacterium]|nr:AraC family transcriptional regulator [Oscillospiraceae bacterium]